MYIGLDTSTEEDMENKLKLLTVVTLIGLLVARSAVTASTEQTIYVNTTTSDPSCCKHNNSSSTCTTLGDALSCVAQYWNESVRIILPSGNYSLNQSLTVQDASDIEIAGDGLPDEVIVKCEENDHDKSGTGLSFIHSQHITITNITLSNCGAEHNSTSRNFSGDACNHYTQFTFSKYKVALYFEFCTHISLFLVTIKNSDGVGLTFVDTNGTNMINNSNFSNNSATDLLMPGGVECTLISPLCPGDTECANGSNGTKLNLTSQIHHMNSASAISHAMMYPLVT